MAISVALISTIYVDPDGKARRDIAGAGDVYVEWQVGIRHGYICLDTTVGVAVTVLLEFGVAGAEFE